MRKLIVHAWDYLFNSDVSPLRHIPDIGTRHMVLQLLGWMWAITFSLAIGSYTLLPASLLGHAFLIGAVAITVATYTTATTSPRVFVTGLGRAKGGEHE